MILATSMSSSGKAQFSLERDLVAHFARCLRRGDSPWGKVSIGFEFDYQGGWADVFVMCSEGRVIAFEAKLSRWREALHQAYRTRCFANRAYVVLPAGCAIRAARFEPEFCRRHVGLCAMDADGRLDIVLETEDAVPLQPWMAERAAATLEQKRGSRGKCPMTRSWSALPKQSVTIEG